MATANDTPQTEQLPLAVDLDGTLIRSDLMWESLVRLLREKPVLALAAPFWLLRGRAFFKQQLAARVRLDATTLPYNEAFLAWLRAQSHAGRKLILSTASDRTMVEPVARHIGLFDEVLTSDGQTNLRDETKLVALTGKHGERGFDYAGNSSADLAVWSGAREAIVVNANDRLARRAAECTKLGPTFPKSSSLFHALIRTLRPHQWVKNFIVFVPLITSHNLSFTTLLSGLGAFIALCLCTSGGKS